MVGPDAQAAARDLVHRVNERLDEALRVAMAAQLRADTGDTDGALAMLQDVEQPLYDATILLNAASLLRGSAKP
jgi:hypothetical protein